MRLVPIILLLFLQPGRIDSAGASASVAATPTPSVTPSSPNPSPSPSASELPVLELRPDEGRIGTRVEANGANWDPSSKVRLFFDEDDSSPIFDLTADSEGRFGACLTVPDRPPGSYTFRACQHCDTEQEFSTNSLFRITVTQEQPLPENRCRLLALSEGVLEATGPEPTPKADPEIARARRPPGPRPTSSPLPPDQKQLETAVNAAFGIAPGYMAFNPSREMRIGEVERVEVNIRRALAEDLTEAVKKQLRSGLTGRGRPDIDRIEVTDVLEVTLRGFRAFEIDEITPATQRLLGEEVTSWKWNVEPKQSGPHSLILCVNIQVQTPGGRDPRSNCSIERIIRVQVNRPLAIRTFLANNWQWILGTPIVGALGRETYRRWKRRRESPGHP
ncbi:MAG: hypothetical protein ACRDJG_06380 [Actinomycetota bacterium]